MSEQVLAVSRAVLFCRMPYDKQLFAYIAAKIPPLVFLVPVIQGTEALSRAIKLPRSSVIKFAAASPTQRLLVFTMREYASTIAKPLLIVVFGSEHSSTVFTRSRLHSKFPA